MENVLTWQDPDLVACCKLGKTDRTFDLLLEPRVPLSGHPIRRGRVVARWRRDVCIRRRRCGRVFFAVMVLPAFTCPDEGGKAIDDVFGCTIESCRTSRADSVDEKSDECESRGEQKNDDERDDGPDRGKRKQEKRKGATPAQDIRIPLPGRVFSRNK